MKLQLPLAGRAFAVAFIALLILVPIEMIKGKVSERQARAEGVVRQFAAETSRAQVVTGPFLALTCEETYVEERQVMRGGKAETVSESKKRRCPTAYFVPRSLKVSATMPVERLHRGIYPIRMYRADLQMTGEFDWPAPPPRGGVTERTWKRAYLVTAVSDARGIKSIQSGQAAGPLAAPDDKGLAQFANREDLGDHAELGRGSRRAFSYRMSLVGTSSLEVTPIGDSTEIRLASDWPHPSFTEAWSPDERRIGRDGFEATWRVTSIATGGQVAWQDVASNEKIAALRGAGVNLFDPLNIYSLSYRATEYAFLFVLFTFGALALAEAVAGIRLHAIQYALTGAALAVFFLLLLALSEHVSFVQAYAVAAAACISLLTFYLRHPLGTTSRAAAFFGLFVALYGSLYGLLRSEDNALLTGSVMVFALLAFTMIATRKMDWGAAAKRLAPQG